MILYCGIAKWRAITIRYTSLLEASFGKRASVRYSLKKSPMPVEKNATIHWQSDALGIIGTWERLDPPFETKIFESTEGAIKWQCLHPKSRAAVNLGCEKVVRGLGYVERVDMTLPPWKLPIQKCGFRKF